MAEYTLKINERSKQAKAFLEFIKTYASDNKFIALEKIPNKTTKKAISEAREGKGEKISDVKNFLNSL